MKVRAGMKFYRAVRNGPKGQYFAPIHHTRPDCSGFSPHSKVVPYTISSPTAEVRVCKKCGGGTA